MNETTKAIVELLCEGKPELQVAAAQVLGELRPKDAVAIEALGDGPDRSPVLGRFCLDALAKIGTPAALAKLAEAVVEHEVLSDHAAQLLGEIGAPAHGVLASAYPQAIGEQRVRILGVLARERGREIGRDRGAVGARSGRTWRNHGVCGAVAAYVARSRRTWHSHGVRGTAAAHAARSRPLSRLEGLPMGREQYRCARAVRFRRARLGVCLGLHLR